MTDYSEFKLPATVVPSHYDLLIHSDLKALRFSGVVTTTLKVTDPKGISELTFNAGPKMKFGKAIVTCEQLKTETKQSIDQVSTDSKKERATVKLATPLPSGAEAKLTVAFESEIDDSMMGYYYATSEHEGKKIISALTQFEPTSQRRAFPGWDEPALKVTVSFKMIHRKENVALANMPVEKETDVAHDDIEKLLRVSEFGVQAPYHSQYTSSKPALKTEGKTEIKSTADEASNNWVLTEYGITPKLSTYLIAWAEGPFSKLSSSIKSPHSGREIGINVYATEDFIKQAQYTVEVTKKVLPVYEQVFDIEYPLPKLDTLVAADFDAGAMENWGLITGRTSVYLYDPEKSGLKGQKQTAAVQSHEVAHQWFGNRTTMKFWDCLWLNEAFATLMGEVVILDRCFPEWESASEFIHSHLQLALDLDSKRSSHPIEVPLSTETGDLESAINQIFDAISYSKGASVLRMLSQMVGEDVFLKGVSLYLKKHAYGNAQTEDLWEGISKSSGQDINKIMHKWILQQGFPVLSIQEGTNSIKVTQNRFLSTGDVKPEEDETLWYIPLALKTVGNNGAEVDQSAVLAEKREIELPIKDVKNSIWKLNADTTGVYRVAYSPEHLAKLGKEAANKSGVFSLEDRIGLVSDAFVLAEAGYGKTSGGLDLLKGFNLGDDRYLVNAAAASHLASITSVWWEQPQELQDALDAFRADMFGPTVKKLGFDFPKTDSPDMVQLRAEVIRAAAAASDEYTLSEIKRRFAPLMEKGDDSLIPADIMRTVFSQAVKHGGEKEFETVLAVYRKPETPDHQQAALLGMSQTRDPKLLDRYIKWAFESSEVKLQNFMYPVAGLSMNPLSRRRLFEEMTTRYEEILKRFEGNFSLGRIFQYSLSGFTTKKDLEAVEAFFKDKDTGKYSSSLKQGLDSVRANTAWLERDAADVEAWLKANNYLK
ncbi:putative AAP1-alanine/arginine aminopeptidase [Microstroma glucosiphilum]|uniref:Aminopeptidase n=1 Tax=Pseudomicrostroma glucosiphilum TaxID=1684307 RepID=A0A316U8P9_9BASI|nr:putative AAP1-alanine/arginine aminopeptidase [Pseudomicrostroma glucosiphilum]PWN20753.1 putative AAP1-alanine/arginine aminopeptidase [Pseudomicrostroma glucosiphilum]